MNKHHDTIRAYLSELKQALRGQPAGFVQDVLYDAEHHLYDALQENSASRIEDIVENYGSPGEIASQYIQMEQDSQEYLGM